MALELSCSLIKNMLNTGHYCWCLKPRPFSDLSRGPCGAFCFILGCFFVVLSNSFIVIQFTGLIVPSFKVHISVVSGLFRELCNQRTSQFENICFTPRKKLWSQSPLPTFFPALQPAPGNFSSASCLQVCLLWMFVQIDSCSVCVVFSFTYRDVVKDHAYDNIKHMFFPC